MYRPHPFYLVLLDDKVCCRLEPVPASVCSERMTRHSYKDPTPSAPRMPSPGIRTMRGADGFLP